jgi:phage tail-like protein
VRGLIAGLPSPHPLGLQLPSLYHEDDFAQRFSAALDDLISPVVCTLDNLAAYLDPMLTPDDFVEWLATWVGVTVDEEWPEVKKRALVAQAGDLYRWRGTVRGIKALVEVYAGVTPEVEESGGVAWSATPGSAVPGTDTAGFVVRLLVQDPDAVDRARLEAIVASASPAHVPCRVEVVTS